MTPRGNASLWARGASFVMAALAVLALGVTVAASHRALSEASDAVARGEAEIVLSSIAADLAEEPEEQRESPATLAQTLEDHKEEGLRYIAVVGRDHKTVAEAGTSTFGSVPYRAREPRIKGGRVQVLRPAFGPRRSRTPRQRATNNATGARRRRHRFTPRLLVAEIEPPALGSLRTALMRIAVVAAGASGVLLAFAVALTRNSRRLADIDARAAREQRLISLGSMSSVMAHELRNPLASLKGNAQLLVEDLEDEATPRDASHQRAERIVAEAKRLEDLTSSLLDFVRDGPIERDTVSLDDLFASATAGLDASRIDVDRDGAPDTVHVDRNRMPHALRNLLANALEAAEDSRIELTARALGSDVVITVRDHGKGIESGEEERIFEPFVTTRVRGTGLGLALARRIAEQHGGSLTGDNHPDGGAVFTLTLPMEVS